VSVDFFQNDKLKKIEQATKSAFAKVKEELDEHLEAINQNTTETSAQSESIKQLEQKIEKLEEKFEHILELLGERHQYNLEPLTLREQEVFFALYQATDYKICTAKTIALKTGLPVLMIDEVVDALIAKGVPIYRREIDAEYELILDPQFKQAQAKHNLIKISPQMIKHLS
jgi:predicted  nucleic acid-binding Zn-ribbon protein